MRAKSDDSDDMPETPRLPFPFPPDGFTEPGPEAWQQFCAWFQEQFDDGGRPLEQDYLWAQIVWFAERKLKGE